MNIWLRTDTTVIHLRWMAVPSLVSQADDDNHNVTDLLLWCGLGIETFSVTTLDAVLTSIEVVVAPTYWGMYPAVGSDFGKHWLGFTRWYRPKSWRREAEGSGRSCGTWSPLRRRSNNCCRLAEIRRECLDCWASFLCGQPVNDKATCICHSTASIVWLLFGWCRWSILKIFPTNEWPLPAQCAIFNFEDCWSDRTNGQDILPEILESTVL